VILISGRGSNMQAIVEQSRRGELHADVRAVISDRPAAPGLAIARELGIDAGALRPGEFPTRAAYDAALGELIARWSPDVVVLAGFMRILSPDLVARFAGKMLNIHPSLLPKYPGLHTHQRALAAGDTEHGASVHFVTEELDGGPVILQSRVKILPGDDEAALSARVQRQEHRIYPEALKWLAEGRVALRAGRPWFDGEPLTEPVMIDATGD
jgi:phosphoribosylglycinamide formyltransferase 1